MSYTVSGGTRLLQTKLISVLDSQLDPARVRAEALTSTSKGAYLDSLRSIEALLNKTFSNVSRNEWASYDAYLSDKRYIEAAAPTAISKIRGLIETDHSDPTMKTSANQIAIMIKSNLETKNKLLVEPGKTIAGALKGIVDGAAGAAGYLQWKVFGAVWPILLVGGIGAGLWFFGPQLLAHRALKGRKK